MTTRRVALRIMKLCKQRKFSEARQELFAPDAVCIEPDGSRQKGLRALEKKQKLWEASMDALHGVRVAGPLVNGNTFSLAFTWDVTYKGRPRGGWKEIGVYQVKNGKVVLEHYHYDLFN